MPSFKHICITTLLLLSLSSCKKEEVQESPTCGCDSEPVRVIDSTKPLIGEMYYLKEREDRDYFTNHFWIAYTYPECGNCQDALILCDSELLVTEFQDLYDVPDTEPILVEFSGTYLTPCTFPRGSVSDISFYRLNNYQIKRID